MSTVYEINKGINKSIEFKGIKAQYITYLAVGLVLSLILFVVLYMCHLSLYVVVGVVVVVGGGLIGLVKYYSDRFGEHGLDKHIASSRVPKSITSSSRDPFVQLISHDKVNKPR